MNVALYARVSTVDQKSLGTQIEEMRRYCLGRGWQVVKEVEEVGSGGKVRPQREGLLQAARKREVDCIVVWKLDRWGRSMTDLVVTLQELREINVQFVSVRDALDFTTSVGRALAGMLAVFAEFERDILRERVKAGVDAARAQGRVGGRPKVTTEETRQKIKEMLSKGISKAKIAREMRVSRMTVGRVGVEP
jgi:putative DNA-invertase from lambdoid prophage Rac